MNQYFGSIINSVGEKKSLTLFLVNKRVTSETYDTM